jgi:predicted PurR-regulated permease PerM
MNKDTTVVITAGTIFKALLIILFFILLYIVRDVVMVVITAVVIASAIEPATKWLVRKRIPRVLSGVIIYLGAFLLIALLFYILIPPILVETSGLLSNIPQYIKVAEFGPLKSVAPFFHIPTSIPVESLVNNISKVLSDISGGLFETATSFLGGIASFVLMIVISFYLTVKEDGVVHFLQIVTPAKDERYVIDLWKRTQKKIGLWMQGQVLLQLIVSFLIYVGLLILGVPHALLLAVFAFVLEIIPIFGMSLAAIPAFLLAVLNGGLSLGLLVIALYLVVQQFEAHLIYPLVVKKIVGVPPLLVVIALIIGAKLAGLIGIILSVPLSVGLMEYLDDVGKKKNEARSRIA